MEEKRKEQIKKRLNNLFAWHLEKRLKDITSREQIKSELKKFYSLEVKDSELGELETEGFLIRDGERYKVLKPELSQKMNCGTANCLRGAHIEELKQCCRCRAWFCMLCIQVGDNEKFYCRDHLK